MKKVKYIHFLCFFLFILAPDVFKAASKNETVPIFPKDTAEINTLNKLSWDYRRQDPARALTYATRAEKASQKLAYTKGKAFALKNLGVIYWIKGEYKIAQEKYRQSLKFFKQEKNLQEIGNLHNSFGLLYWNLGKYPAAVAEYNIALKIFAKIKDTEGVAIVYNNLGIIYYELGNSDEAIRQYSKALKTYEKLDDPFALSNVYNNIGLIFSDQGNDKRALDYYHFSLDIDRESQNRAGEGKSFINIGTAYYHLGNLTQSEKNHSKAMEIFRQIGDQQGISEALINLGEIDFKRAKFARAETQWQEALRLKQEIGDAKGECLVLINLGRLFVAQKNDTKAAEFLVSAFDLANKSGSLNHQKEAASHLSKLFERKGQTEKALYYYKTFVTVSDSIQNQQSGNRLMDLQITFETKHKQQQLELWKKESLLQKSRKQALIGAIIFLILLSGAFISRQRLKHKKEQKIAQLQIETQQATQRSLELEVKNMEQEIEFNRSSLMAHTQKLIEKNAIVESLMEQINENEDQVQKTMGKLMDTRIVTEDDWLEFKKLFHAVHPAFMPKLVENYPEITQAELRLSALISLRFGTREIASILGISGDSVKKLRQRLRKKMGLNLEEDLENHVMTFTHKLP